MKANHQQFATEADLCRELSAAGRNVSRLTLSRWRRFGLLPLLAQRGLGPGKGTTTYWTQPDIVQQACFVHDLLAKYPARHTVLQILWLSGFDVPLVHFRRAWLHCNKRDYVQSWRVQPSSAPSRPLRSGQLPLADLNLGSFDAGYRGARSLLNIVLLVSGSISPTQSSLHLNKFNQVLNAALLRLSPTGEQASDVSTKFREQVVLLAETLAIAIGQSNLLQLATEAELTKARQHLNVLGGFVQFCIHPTHSFKSVIPQAPFWTPELAEEVGAPLLLYLLALIQMGYGEQLNSTTEALGKLCTVLDAQLAIGTAEVMPCQLEIAEFRRQCASIWRSFAWV